MHALAGAHFVRAIALIEQAAPSLIEQGDITLLQQWLSRIPAPLLQQALSLSLYQAWIFFLQGHFAQCEHLLSTIENAPEHPTVVASTFLDLPQPDERQIHGNIAALRASIASMRNDPATVLQQCQKALALLSEEHILSDTLLWYQGLARWQQGHLSESITTLQRASMQALAKGHTSTAFLVTRTLSYFLKQQGYLHQAAQTNQRLLLAVQDRNAALQPAMGPAYVSLGGVLYEWNKLQEAEEALERGRTLCLQALHIPALLDAYSALAKVRLAQDRPEEAQDLLTEASHLALRYPLPPRFLRQITAFRIHCALLRQDFSEALRWLRESGIDPEQEQPLEPGREREYLLLARILRAQHHYEQARSLLARLLHDAQQQGRTGDAIEILLLLALTLLSLDKKQPAQLFCQQALVLAEPEAYMRLFLDEGPPLKQLLQSLAQRQGRRQGSEKTLCSPTYLNAILAAMPGPACRSESPRQQQTHLPTPQMESLSARELEVLHLIAHGPTNRQIAEHLILAVSTVKWYINQIYGKLHVKSRTQAIARGRALHLLE